ncbi:MAG: ABC transporter ATP-binding protein, partial [Candidatus Eremiobacteraeota bacterium]|nr:ABC transporter ATP-binding protein [Candidatus Eremiobacteraeota bacterium]
LTEHEAAEVVAVVRSIKERGIAVVWIEHVVHALVAVATRMLVLAAGAKLAEGDPKDVLASADVRRVYMGIEA